MNSDGSNPVNLTNSSDNDFSPVLSSDGTRIAFVSQLSDDKIDIFVMKDDGSDKINLTGN